MAAEQLACEAGKARARALQAEAEGVRESVLASTRQAEQYARESAALEAALRDASQRAQEEAALREASERGATLALAAETEKAAEAQRACAGVKEQIAVELKSLAEASPYPLFASRVCAARTL